MRVAAWVVVLALAIAGCASRDMAIRTLPPDQPGAAEAAAVAAAAEAAAVPVPAAPAESGPPPPPVTADDAPSMHTYDPWERLNRFTYRFNARFDEALFLPVANGYRRLPRPLRSGVHNFFGNLGEVHTVINYGLQGRLVPGARSLGRFVINSTLGLGGLLDVARKMRLPAAPTGLSTTLGTWGLHPGPYLVLPFLGPSTVRDGIGLFGDFGMSYAVNVADLYRGSTGWYLTGITLTDQRANSSFRYYATGSPFEYDTIRFLYVRKRLIEDDAVGRRGAKEKREGEVPAGK
jgi:phospholipid-binding lipoprotein MlaA